MRGGRLLDWVSLVLVCAAAVLCGLLQIAFLGQFYVGATIVPLMIIAAIVSNIVLPLLGYRAVRAARGAVLPVLFWLLVVLGLTVYNRPEGDLWVISAFGQSWAFYGVLLLGTVAGFVTIIAVGGLTTRPGPSNSSPNRR